MATIVRKKRVVPAPQPDGKTIYSLDQLPVGALGSLYPCDQHPVTFTISGKSWAGVAVRIDQGAHRVQPGGPDTPSFLARRTKTEQWSNSTCVLYLEAPQREDSPSQLFQRAVHGSGRTISLRARDQSNREAVIPSDTGDGDMVKMISGKKNKFEEAAAAKKAAAKNKANGDAGKPVPAAAKAAGAVSKSKAAKPKAEPELKDCKCGCGESTQRTFRPGHDARYYGWLKKVAEGRMEYQELNRHVRAYLPDLASVKRASSEHWGARA